MVRRGLERLRASFDRATSFDVAGVMLAWTFVAVRIVFSRVGFDDVTYATPAQQVTLDAWREGRMALWSTTSFGGTPQLGNLQLAGMYPLNWLAAPFPDLLGTDVALLVHMLIFGLGFYCLGRVLHLARPAPVAMAIAAMWSGSMVLRSTLIVHLPPLAWMPWAAIAIYFVITAPNARRSTATLAVVAWLILTGGHPQSILMTGTLLLAWAIGLMVEHRGWRRAGYLAASGVLAALAAAPALLAGRAAIDAAAASSRSASALQLPQLVMPLRSLPRYLLGQPMSGLGVLRENERVTYAGAAVVALAIVGIVAAARARRWSFVALALVGSFAASLSLGLRSPTTQFARSFIPGFDQPRVSARWNWVLVMALIVLAGYGIDRLRRHRARREATVLIAASAVTALFVIAASESGGVTNNLLWLAIAGSVVAIALLSTDRTRMAAAVLLAALAVIELTVPMNRYIRWRDAVHTTTADFVSADEVWLAQQPGLTLSVTNEGFTPEYLVQSLRPNANSLVDVRSIDGYDGGTAVSRRWHAGLLQIIPTINDLTFRAQLPGELDPSSMARLGVRFVMWDPARGSATHALPGWTLRERDGLFEIYENPRWIGDAVVWYNTELVTTPEDAGNRLRLDDGMLDQISFVENASGVVACVGQCDADGFTTRSDYSGQREVDIVATAPAVVALHEQFDDGWTAFVDGHKAEVIAVDGIWSGVVVGEGAHHIELRYAPSWMWPSIWLMSFGWIAIVALLSWPVRRLSAASGPAQPDDHGTV